MMTPRKTSAITTFSFQSASAAATIPTTTSVAIAARFAVSPIAEELSPARRILEPRGRGTRTGLVRGTAARHRPGRVVRARAGARGAGRRCGRDRLAGADGGRRAARRRGGDRAPSGLALGADGRGLDDGEALRRPRDAAKTRSCGSPRARRPRRDRAELAGPAARVRDDRGGRPRDHARVGADAHRRPADVVIEV